VSDLTEMQGRFVQEYLIDLNATQAAIRAGYSAQTAAAQASRLLTNVKVQEALSEAQNARQARTRITQDRVVQEIARLGLSDIRGAFNEARLLQPHEWSDDIAAAVASFEVETRKDPGEDGEQYILTKLKLWDKNSALEKLMKHLGLYEKDNEQSKVHITIRDLSGG